MGLGDDVEMEFVSVMGVLVPVEVTNGVSKEALRFATGSLSSDSETEGSTNGHEGDQIHNCSVLADDDVKRKVESESDSKKEIPNRKESEEVLHPAPVSIQKSSKRRVSKKIFTPVDSSAGAMYKTVRGRSNKSKVKETKTVDKKKKVHKATDKTNSIRKPKKKKPRFVTDTWQVCSQSVESSSCKEDIEKAKSIDCLSVSLAAQEDKRLRAANEEISTGKRITEMWKLESDDEDPGSKRKKKKPSSLRSSSTGAKVASVAVKVNPRSSSDDSGVCTYPGCTRLIRYRYRCAEHNNRQRCLVPDCTKFAHSGGKCIAHGGGSRCSEDGCDRRARSQGKCYAHGGGIRCSQPNCNTRAKSKGKCVAHGGGTICSERECTKLAISNGKCISHGGRMNRSLPECDKRAELRDKCVEHSKADERAKTGDSETPKKELDETTMILRNGQRVKLAPSWRNDQEATQSEEEALEMVLRLSEIEY